MITQKTVKLGRFVVFQKIKFKTALLKVKRFKQNYAILKRY